MTITVSSSYHNTLYLLREIYFLLALDSNSYKDEIANLIQQTFHESISQKCRSIRLPNLYKKKQSQDTITKFIKTLVKFISENQTAQIMYVRLVADEPSEMQHYRKSLSTWTIQQKN